ncbi:hypothetical protein TYRP_006995 [Tyrophagus putrescentiae]|nr:hypothetical protein TYRP_006995 [Tyrophagus putrescentiae]
MVSLIEGGQPTKHSGGTRRFARVPVAAVVVFVVFAENTLESAEINIINSSGGGGGGNAKAENEEGNYGSLELGRFVFVFVWYLLTFLNFSILIIVIIIKCFLIIFRVNLGDVAIGTINQLPLLN